MEGSIGHEAASSYNQSPRNLDQLVLLDTWVWSRTVRGVVSDSEGCGQ